MVPRCIKVSTRGILSISWNDGHEGEITLNTLRTKCPCAECRGETILWRKYTPLPQSDMPGKYDVLRMEPVGNYGIQFYWADGHSAGIYTWNMLRELCECPLCKSK